MYIESFSPTTYHHHTIILPVQSKTACYHARSYVYNCITRKSTQASIRKVFIKVGTAIKSIGMSS